MKWCHSSLLLMCSISAAAQPRNSTMAAQANVWNTPAAYSHLACSQEQLPRKRQGRHTPSRFHQAVHDLSDDDCLSLYVAMQPSVRNSPF